MIPARFPRERRGWPWGYPCVSLVIDPPPQAGLRGDHNPACSSACHSDNNFQEADSATKQSATPEHIRADIDVNVPLTQDDMILFTADAHVASTLSVSKISILDGRTGSRWKQKRPFYSFGFAVLKRSRIGLDGVPLFELQRRPPKWPNRFPVF
jgi:hypothetical protein